MPLVVTLAWIEPLSFCGGGQEQLCGKKSAAALAKSKIVVGYTSTKADSNQPAVSFSLRLLGVAPSLAKLASERATLRCSCAI